MLNEELAKIGMDMDEEKFINIPAYTLDSFDKLAENGCFIIDVKNPRSSTWKTGQDFLFALPDQRLNLENWGHVIDHLLTDIAKIAYYNIELNDDSWNLAIVKNEKSHDPQQPQYEVRYFGFDFSSKCSLREIPTMKPLADAPLLQEVKEYLRPILSHLITQIFYYEFHDTANEVNILRFKEDLIERCVKEARSKIQEMVLTSSPI